MTTPYAPGIREVLLMEIEARIPRNQLEPNLQQGSVLDAVSKKLGGGRYRPELDEAILTQWYDLFRTGILSWGLNLSNPNPPFFHLTEAGRRALANATRDPSNPAGYLRHLDSTAQLPPTARSYLIEGLECYVAGHFRAAAVMIGCAAESLMLDLRDSVVERLEALGQPAPKRMLEWKIKTVSDALDVFLNQRKKQFPLDMCAAFEANWSALGFQIRSSRNNAGHPVSIEPVTPDTVHSSLLIFPELARLSNRLSDWTSTMAS